MAKLRDDISKLHTIAEQYESFKRTLYGEDADKLTVDQDRVLREGFYGAWGQGLAYMTMTQGMPAEDLNDILRAQVMEAQQFFNYLPDEDDSGV